MNKILLRVLVVVLVAIGGTAVYFNNQVTALTQNPQAVSQKELEDTIAKVGKIIRLPDGDTPTLATVTDPSKLVGQAFFAKAKQGDKVLLYPNAKKAFLYDPVANKILEIAPIDLGSQPTQKSTSSTK